MVFLDVVWATGGDHRPQPSSRLSHSAHFDARRGPPPVMVKTRSGAMGPAGQDARPAPRRPTAEAGRSGAQQSSVAPTLVSRA